MLSGLEYLNRHGITHRNLQLDNILLDEDDNVKLFNYGLYYMTNGGKYVTFPIGSPKYFAPEVFLNKTRSGDLMHYCDIWSVGLILLELVLGKELWVDLKLPQIINLLTSLRKVKISDKESALVGILEKEGSTQVLDKMSPAVKTLIEECLIVNPCQRPWPKHLLKDMRIFPQSGLSLETADNPFEESNGSGESSAVVNNVCKAGRLCRSQTLPIKINFSKNCSVGEDGGGVGGSEDNQGLLNGGGGGDGGRGQLSSDSFSETSGVFLRDTEDSIERNHNKSLLILSSLGSSTDSSDLLKCRSFKEVYYFWQLAGGDVIAELKRQGLTRKKPAVLSVPQ